MSMPDRPACSEEECLALFRDLFPEGFGGGEVVAELAPAGWEASGLHVAFHPSPEQIHEESARVHRNLDGLFGGKQREKPDGTPLPPPPEPPTLEEIRAEHRPEPVDPRRECAQLVGECVWDVFSDNHEVLTRDGRVVDLGSFRGSAGFIADFAKPDVPPDPEVERHMREMMPDFYAQMDEQKARFPEMAAAFDMGYMQFYMGSHRTGGRADLRPVYRLLFRRLRARGMDWEYHFPRLQVVDLRPLKQEMDEKKAEEEGTPEWESYDPSAAFGEAVEEQEQDEDLARTREKLDEAYRESVEDARVKPPPTTVQAYQAVYGRLPKGWPPVAQ